MKRRHAFIEESRVRPQPGGGLLILTRDYGMRRCRLPGCGEMFHAVCDNNNYCQRTHSAAHQRMKLKAKRDAVKAAIRKTAG